MAYGSWRDDTAEAYYYWGNDEEGNGYTGTSVAQSLVSSDDKYVWVRDKWGKPGDLGIAAANFNQPPNSVEYKFFWLDSIIPYRYHYEYKYFYRNSIDRIEFSAEIMCDITWPWEFTESEDLQIRLKSDQGYLTNWVIIDYYPNKGTYSIEQVKIVITNAQYPTLFDNIRYNLDFIENVEVEIRDCSESWITAVYINIDTAYVVYYDD